VVLNSSLVLSFDEISNCIGQLMLDFYLPCVGFMCWSIDDM
jgi:hypothetical protein